MSQPKIKMENDKSFRVRAKDIKGEQKKEKKGKERMRQNGYEDTYVEEGSKRESDLVTEGVLFFFFNSATKTPIKRSDFATSVLKELKSSELLRRILYAVQTRLDKIFGISVYSYNEVEKTFTPNINSPESGFNAFIQVGKFNSMDDELDVNEKTVKEKGEDSVLFITLTLIFMMTNMEAEGAIGLPLHVIWSSIVKLELKEILEIKREDELAKFMKNNYVNSLYLKVEEIVSDQDASKTFYYSWGPRAQLEYSKLNILAFVSRLTKTNPKNYADQYGGVLNSSEKTRALKILPTFNVHSSESEATEESSALNTTSEPNNTHNDSSSNDSYQETPNDSSGEENKLTKTRVKREKNKSSGGSSRRKNKHKNRSGSQSFDEDSDSKNEISTKKNESENDSSSTNENNDSEINGNNDNGDEDTKMNRNEEKEGDFEMNTDYIDEEGENERIGGVNIAELETEDILDDFVDDSQGFVKIKIEIEIDEDL